MKRRRVVRREITGCNRIHIDAVLRPLIGENTREAHHAAFGSRVRRHPDAALIREHAGDIDDLAAFACRDHGFCRRLTKEEEGFEVDIHHRIPVFFSEVDGVVSLDDARIVHENIETAEDLFRFVYNALNWLRATKVCHDDMSFTARREDFFNCVFRRGTTNQREICAGFSECDGHALTKAGIGAGNNGDFARKIEWMCHACP